MTTSSLLSLISATVLDKEHNVNLSSRVTVWLPLTDSPLVDYSPIAILAQ